MKGYLIPALNLFLIHKCLHCGGGVVHKKIEARRYQSPLPYILRVGRAGCVPKPTTVHVQSGVPREGCENRARATTIAVQTMAWMFPALYSRKRCQVSTSTTTRMDVLTLSISTFTLHRCRLNTWRDNTT